MPIMWIGGVLPKTIEQDAGRGYCYTRRESNLKYVLCRVSNGSYILARIQRTAGMVSIARIERPPLHRGGSASTETTPAVSHSPSKLARLPSPEERAGLVLHCARRTTTALYLNSTLP